MTVESVVYISDLDATYPAGGDAKSEGDNHIRNLKTGIKNTFPNISGVMSASQAELNYIDGLDRTAVDAFNAISASLSNLDARTTTLSASVSAINTQVSGLSVSISQIWAQVGSVSGALSSRVTTLSDSVSAINTLLNTHSASISAINSSIAATNAQLVSVSGALSARVTTLSNSVSAINTQVAGLSVSISQIWAQVTSISGALANQIASVSGALSTRITTLSNSVSVINTYKLSTYRSAEFAISHAVSATLNFDTKNFNDGSAYSTATGVFTPLREGYYQVYGSFTPSHQTVSWRLKKNNTLVQAWYGAANVRINGYALIHCNGSTDNIHVVLYNADTPPGSHTIDVVNNLAVLEINGPI